MNAKSNTVHTNLQLNLTDRNLQNDETLKSMHCLFQDGDTVVNSELLDTLNDYFHQARTQSRIIADFSKKYIFSPF